MSKFFMFLSFLLFSSMVFVSCFDSDCETGMSNSMGVVNNCALDIKCETDDDCKEVEGWTCSNSGQCIEDPCLYESCGMGKCIPHDNPETKDEKELFYCQCDEGATFYVDVCVLDCDNNATCEEFSKTSEIWEAFEYCDTEKGHCVDYNPNN